MGGGGGGGGGGVGDSFLLKVYKNMVDKVVVVYKIKS